MGLGYTVEQATSILAASTSVGLGIAAIIAMPLLAIPGGIALGIAGVSLFLKQKKRKKHD